MVKIKSSARSLRSFVFSGREIVGKCKLKKSKYKRNYRQNDAEDRCINDFEENYMFYGKYAHRCDVLAKKDCKMVKNTEDNSRKMCKAKMLSNPCKECKSKTTCS